VEAVDATTEDRTQWRKIVHDAVKPRTAEEGSPEHAAVYVKFQHVRCLSLVGYCYFVEELSRI